MRTITEPLPLCVATVVAERTSVTACSQLFSALANLASSGHPYGRDTKTTVSLLHSWVLIKAECSVYGSRLHRLTRWLWCCSFRAVPYKYHLATWLATRLQCDYLAHRGVILRVTATLIRDRSRSRYEGEQESPGCKSPKVWHVVWHMAWHMD